MRTLGLLGGMSWESTVLYYQLINRRVRTVVGGLHSMPCILYSVDFAEIAALQSSGEWDKAGEILADAACNLKAAGAEAIVICTNTMHRNAPRIEEKSQIPLLHIADFTGKAIRRAGCSSIALLGTRYTMEAVWYREKMESDYGLKVIVPETRDRDEVHRIIYEELVNGIINPESKAQYIKIANQLIAQGAESLILGCTEIVMLISQNDISVPVFDTTALHAEGAADWAISSN